MTVTNIKLIMKHKINLYDCTLPKDLISRNNSPIDRNTLNEQLLLHKTYYFNHHSTRNFLFVYLQP